MAQNQNKYKNAKKSSNGNSDIKLRKNNISHTSYYGMPNEVEEPNIADEEINEEASNPKGPVIPSIPSLPKIPKANNNLGKAVKAKVKGLNFLSFFNKYRIIIVIAIMIAVIFGLLVLTASGMFEEGSSGSSSSGTVGYYDSSCNFNEARVDYTSVTSSYSGLTLESFVIGSTYSYIKDSSYSDEGIKALMVIIKTNALGYGNYNNSSKTLTISDSYIKHVPIEQISSINLNRLTKLYNSVSDEIYVAGSYSGTITNLTSSDALSLDETVLTNLMSLQQTKKYNEILESLYNSNNENKKIYKISNNCTYYTLTENDSYWWPIGSSTPTSGNIYGGTPTATKISSYFGPREIQGISGNHGAIDIGASCQSNVVIAARAGTVKTASNGCDNNGYYKNPCGGGFGNYITIDHGDGMVTIYAHLYPDSIVVKSGQKVEQGEKLALVGNSGSSTGCHLHFEMRLNGTKVDPLNYVSVENPRSVSKYNLVVVSDNVTTPADTKVATCKSLLASGFSKNAVAGMLVNIQAEGSFKLNNLEGCYEENQCCFDGTYGFCKHPEITGFGSDTAYTNGVDSGSYSRDKFVNDHAGYGLIQWTSSGRKAGLYDFAKSKNKSIADLGVQLGYLLEEIKQPAYATTYKYITGNYSAYDVANNFCLNFESPRNENTTCPNRASANSASMLTFVENGCS